MNPQLISFISVWWIYARKKERKPSSSNQWILVLVTTLSDAICNNPMMSLLEECELISDPSEEPFLWIYHLLLCSQIDCNLKCHRSSLEMWIWGFHKVSDLQERISDNVSRTSLYSYLSHATVLQDLINYVLNLFINALLAQSAKQWLGSNISKELWKQLTCP